MAKNTWVQRALSMVSLRVHCHSVRTQIQQQLYTWNLDPGRPCRCGTVYQAWFTAVRCLRPDALEMGEHLLFLAHLVQKLSNQIHSSDSWIPFQISSVFKL